MLIEEPPEVELQVVHVRVRSRWRCSHEDWTGEGQLIDIGHYGPDLVGNALDVSIQHSADRAIMRVRVEVVAIERVGAELIVILLQLGLQDVTLGNNELARTDFQAASQASLGELPSCSKNSSWSNRRVRFGPSSETTAFQENDRFVLFL